MDKNLWTPKDPLACIGLITQMENSPTPGESCIANSLPLGQSKVVNAHLIPGGPSGFQLIAPLESPKILFKFFRLLLLFTFCSVDDCFCVDELCNINDLDSNRNDGLLINILLKIRL